MKRSAPPIFVINLARSEARRRETDARLQALGLTYSIVAAHDGAAAAASDATARPWQPHLGRPLTAGEVGCLLSHVSALERILVEEHPMACVLEDDCAFDETFADILDAIGGTSPRWDLLLLGHHSSRHGPRVGAETCYGGIPIGPYRIARVAEFPMGAYAYVVTANGARKLVRHARPLRMPVDWVTGYSPVAGVRLYAVTPPCVMPVAGSAVPTTIPGRELSVGLSRSASSFWSSFGSSLRRRVGRLFLTVRKLGVRPDAYVKRF